MHQGFRDTRFVVGMSSVRDNDEFRLRKGVMQVPGGLHGRTHIVTALDDDRGDIPECLDIADYPTVVFKKSPVHEIVAFDAREGLSESFVTEMGDLPGPLQQVDGTCPPRCSTPVPPQF